MIRRSTPVPAGSRRSQLSMVERPECIHSGRSVVTVSGALRAAAVAPAAVMVWPRVEAPAAEPAAGAVAQLAVVVPAAARAVGAAPPAVVVSPAAAAVRSAVAWPVVVVAGRHAARPAVAVAVRRAPASAASVLPWVAAPQASVRPALSQAKFRPPDMAVVGLKALAFRRLGADQYLPGFLALKTCLPPSRLAR